MEVIQLTEVSKTYGQGGGATAALTNVSLTFHTGEFACIWGASGSGKSTLLNLLGLIDKPDTGTMLFNGLAVSSLTEREACDYRNRTIGFIFQNFNLLPVLNAVENVMIPLQIRGVDDSVARRKAEALLAEVGLSQQMRRRPDEMSGGQRQRIAIARALVTDPLVVLADEPTANLDSSTGEDIIKIMKQINGEKHVTFIFSTHDHTLLGHASRKVQLKDGRIVENNQHRAERQVA
jgi:putative ABC transport system ATP-binding protein